MRSDTIVRAVEPEAPSRAPAWPTQVLDALEQAVVALVAADRERRVVYSNRRIDELLGAEPWQPDRHGRFASLPRRRRALAQGRVTRAREFQLAAGGREITLKAEALPIRDEDGELVAR